MLFLSVKASDAGRSWSHLIYSERPLSRLWGYHRKHLGQCCLGHPLIGLASRVLLQQWYFESMFETFLTFNSHGHCHIVRDWGQDSVEFHAGIHRKHQALTVDLQSASGWIAKVVTLSVSLSKREHMFKNKCTFLHSTSSVLFRLFFKVLAICL